ncbi:MAG TPA: heavy metal-binding domain-containing protein [Candidatus Angelobacter sp.]|nr:heavy metal-binding domain-containing protein [Candidatus Angelobacter sp.]
MFRYLRTLCLVLLAGLLPAAEVAAQSAAQSPSGAESTNPAEAPVEFVCPMHPDVRSSQPGHCHRCGMELVANLADRIEYPLALRVEPSHPKAGDKVQLTFSVSDPKTGKPIEDFLTVHEKLYHIFIVSQDMKYFRHDHPERGADGVFRLSTVLPKPGMYRILSDFYPKGGAPQLVVKTLILPGAPITAGASLSEEISPKQSTNMKISLTMQPPEPVAGMKTLLFFHLDPADGIEPYLGAWSHMLAASDDLVDMIHDHPFLADGGPKMQFNMIFPRPRVYRVWVQFQRLGQVNTAVFDIPVRDLGK